MLPYLYRKVFGPFVPAAGSARAPEGAPAAGTSRPAEAAPAAGATAPRAEPPSAPPPGADAPSQLSEGAAGRPEAPPLRPRPSLDYLPRDEQARRVDQAYVGLMREDHAALRHHLETTGDFPPGFPSDPSGVRDMTPEEAAATRHFRRRYEQGALEARLRGNGRDFSEREYMQTYRKEGRRMIPNQEGFIVGERDHVSHRPGLYPPGTRVDIHSHPDLDLGINAMPSYQDQRLAHRNRTNALHRPGTSIPRSIVYFPPADAFLGYTGELSGPGGRPEFHVLADNQPEAKVKTRYASIPKPPAPPSA